MLSIIKYQLRLFSKISKTLRKKDIGLISFDYLVTTEWLYCKANSWRVNLFILIFKNKNHRATISNKVFYKFLSNNIFGPKSLQLLLFKSFSRRGYNSSNYHPSFVVLYWRLYINSHYWTIVHVYMCHGTFVWYELIRTSFALRASVTGICSCYSPVAIGISWQESYHISPSQNISSFPSVTLYYLGKLVQGGVWFTSHDKS